MQNLVDLDLQNPLKVLRQQVGITSIEGMSKIANIRTAAIGQAEEGFYPNPLPAYLLALGIRPGTNSEEDVIQKYKAYQSNKRKLNGPLHDPKLILNPKFSSNEHPLVTWRRQSGLATYGFCSAYCIHMPTVNRFEKDIIEINENPPTVILNSLKEAGYELEEFIEACIIYKATLLNNFRTLNNLPPVGAVG